jgi:Ser/Thr protein kinase RdoA (MazF antagonist)
VHRPSQALLLTAAKLFSCKSQPDYFAGGHRWSDGIVYYHQDSNLMIKLTNTSTKDKLSALKLRLQFARYLAENGICCLSPINSVNGELVENLFDEGENYLCYAWPKLEGNTLQDLHPVDLKSFYAAWGSLVGKCHRLASSYPIWHESVNPEAISISKKVGAETLAIFNPDSEVRQAWFELHELLSKRHFNRATHGFIHNDPHPQNIIQQGSNLSLLDFDVAGLHFFATDVAICIYSEYSRLGFHSCHKLARSEMKVQFLRPFMEAYLVEYSLPETELKDIELFLNYRRMVMFAVFYEQIAKANPEYLKQFKAEILSAKPYLEGLSLIFSG